MAPLTDQQQQDIAELAQAARLAQIATGSLSIHALLGGFDGGYDMHKSYQRKVERFLHALDAALIAGTLTLDLREQTMTKKIEVATFKTTDMHPVTHAFQEHTALRYADGWTLHSWEFSPGNPSIPIMPMRKDVIIAVYMKDES